jgi:hypothetical protein
MNGKYNSHFRSSRTGPICLLLQRAAGRSPTWLPGLFLILAITSTLVQGHSLGDFSINRYSRLELNLDYIRIQYVVDMAEIPAVRELGRMDADDDGAVSETERRDYLHAEADRLSRGLYLAVGGNPLEPRLISRELTTPAGQAGHQTLRMHLVLEADLSEPVAGEPWLARYRDDNYQGHPGWKEVVVRPMPGVELISANVPRIDQSNALRNYPQDLLTNPPDVSQAILTFAPGKDSAAAPPTTIQPYPSALVVVLGVIALGCIVFGLLSISKSLASRGAVERHNSSC